MMIKSLSPNNDKILPPVSQSVSRDEKRLETGEGWTGSGTNKQKQIDRSVVVGAGIGQSMAGKREREKTKR
jgi:hypothetical protein